MLKEAADLREIALKVARELRGHKPDGEVVGMGADGTPTSGVDREADEVINRESSRLGFNLLSEESGPLDRGSDWTIVADPIDGTRNLIRGVPFYCTSLALVQGSVEEVDLDRVVYGIVLDLEKGELFEGLKGEGASLDGKEAPIGQSEKFMSISTLRVGEDLAKRLMGWNVRALGAAALEICYVACGRLDLYYNDGKGLRITDIAASSLVLRESGGELYDLIKKRRLTMGSSLTERAKVLAVIEDEVASEWLS